MKKQGQVTYIAGMQWGDEGKGKLVDILSEKYDIIARSAGGANAGHTICVKQASGVKKYVFHLLPSGILWEGKICVIGNGTVVHLPTLLEEIKTLEEQGIKVRDRLLLSDRAHLIFEYHKIVDDLEEKGRGEKKVGTTKRGIGPAYTDKAARRGIRVGDLRHFESFAEKLRKNAENYMRVYGFTFDIEKEINLYKDLAEDLDEIIADTEAYLSEAVDSGKSVLIEGAQATHLDLDFGNYPYVTSSSTISAGGCLGVGLAPRRLDSVIGIMKAYCTRVGEGPFPSELGGFEGDMMREKGAEYGATTGRPRRCGWLDLVVVRQAVRLNGADAINMTKLDVLSGLKTVKMAIGYTLGGTPLRHPPAHVEDLARVEVQYKELPGWEEPLGGVTLFKKLPQNAQAFVKAAEEILGIPVRYIGTGSRRDEMIVR